MSVYSIWFNEWSVFCKESKTINGAAIQYKDEGRWVTLIKLVGLHRNVIHQFNVNVETRELRVYRGGVIDLQYLGIASIRYLGIGCWRIFGVHINR